MKFHKAGSRKKARRTVKKNPAKAHKRRRAVRRNPAAPSSVRRKTRRRAVRRNPSLDLKGLGIDVAAIGGGMLGALYVNNLAARWLPARFRGVASILVGAGLTMFVKHPLVERAALGAAGMGLVDILRANIPALVALSAEDAGYLLGNAAAQDQDLSNLLGAMDNGDLPDVLGGVDNADVSDVLGFDTGSIPLGFDTGSIPLGEDEADNIFGEEDYDL